MTPESQKSHPIIVYHRMERHKQGNFYVVASSVNRLVWAVMPLLLRFSTKVKEFLVFRIRSTLCISLKSRLC